MKIAIGSWRRLADSFGASTCKIEPNATSVVNETESILRVRLRSAASLLCLGFSAFYIKQWWQGGYGDPFMPRSIPFIHLGVILVTLVAARRLCPRYPHTLNALRAWELVVFGAPALFFVWMEWKMGSYMLALGNEFAWHDFLAEVTIPWVTLIFLYGMYIPNTWRRAAAMVSAMAILPIIVVALSLLSSPDAVRYVTGDSLGTFLLWISLPSLAAVYGAHKIGVLRKEAAVARQLGSYHLVRKLGAGGMGEVYLAEHRLLKRPCAIKLIRPAKALDPQALARFESEVHNTARLTHWNSIEIFDFGRTEDGTFYYVMEYLPGVNLQEMVEETGPLPPERVIHLVRQVCAALKEAHGLGLVHRDIKPGNIFATERGGIWDVAKLLDFGLVKSTIPNRLDPKVSTDGLIIGSPLYVAPELGLGESTPDVRSDIYSLGATAFYLLTGRPIFTHDNPLKLLFAHANETVARPSSFNPDTPADLEEVILHCLAKEPGERFPDVASLDLALASCECAEDWTPSCAANWWANYLEQGRTMTPASRAELRDTTILEAHA